MTDPLPPVTPLGLTLPKLNLPKESTYFTLVLILSIVFWLFIAITIVGIFYAALIGFFIWIGNGLLVAHLRSEAIRVDERQLPELYQTFREVCQQLGVSSPSAQLNNPGAAALPSLYVVQAGGMLNAFATRFAGRNFVVVYADFLAALGPSSPEMKFILGHELGHIKSNHILKHVFLGPGMLFPLIGPAYRRAWESSCDRYGAFAAQDVESSLRAMMILWGGKENGRKLNADAFAAQFVEERGFFVSLHELTAHYPTLSRRVSDLMALKTGGVARSPDRNPLAYIFAIFIPGGNAGGGGGGPAAAMVMVVMIGLMAAMAIPAFQKVREASIGKVCLNNLRQYSAAFDQYVLENGRPPRDLTKLVGPGAFIKHPLACPAGGEYIIPSGATSGDEIACSVHGTMEHFSLPQSPYPARR